MTAGKGGAAGAAPPTDEALVTAARLLSRGVNVLPLRGDGRPAMAWKPMQERRQIDEDTDEIDAFLCKWWDHHHHHGVGAVTGTISGVVVVDIDDDQAAELVERTCGGAFPRTVLARTRRGHHLWFRHPEGDRPNRAHIGGVGLDVRGDGGFVAVPPTGGKAWVISPWEHERGMWPPAAMPTPLMELLWPPKPAPPKPTAQLILSSGGGRGYARTALENEAQAVRTAPVGARNHTLNKAAFAVARLVHSGELSASEMVADLLAAARQAGLPEQEAEATIASGLKARTA